MDRTEAKLWLDEAKKRNRTPLLERLVDNQFPKQRAFVLDQNDFISALCTRRAGKSYGLGLRLFRAALRHPGSVSPYIGLTRESAHNIMWPVLSHINRRFGINAAMAESDLTLRLSNGSTVKLFGADMKNFIERLRGGKYAEAQIDEGQSFRSHLSTLIDDILTPALGDLRGSLVLTGTPGPIPSGPFFDASNGGSGYSPHAWTLYENPYFPKPHEFVQRLMEKKGWTDQNPTYLREYQGKWVIDLDALVYKFKADRNQYDALPIGIKWSFVVAVDYGWNDQTAFAVAAFSEHSPNVFLVHAEGHAEMVPSLIAKRLHELIEEYRPISVIADTGGLGKSITEEFIRRYHLAIEPAEKREKLTYINLMNGDFIDGRCFVHSSLKRLKDQYETLIKAENPTASRYEDPTLPNDLCDAALYAYRKAKHYLGIQPTIYKPGSDEFHNNYARELEEADAEALNNPQPWWMQ